MLSTKALCSERDLLLLHVLLLRTPLASRCQNPFHVLVVSQLLHLLAFVTTATENWKAQTLPLARIKKIMKSEEGIYQEMERERQVQQAAAAGAPPPTTQQGPSTRFMIAGEAPVLLGKACELLIKELTVRAWRHTERNRRRTLQRQDVHAAVGESEVYDFLIDIVPRITTSQVPQKAYATPAAMPDTTIHPPQPAVAAPPGMGVVAPPDGSNMVDAEARFAHLQQMQDQMAMHEHYMMQMQQARMQAEGQPPAPGQPVMAPTGHPMHAQAPAQPQPPQPPPPQQPQQQTAAPQPQQGIPHWAPPPTNGNNPMQPPPPAAGV